MQFALIEAPEPEHAWSKAYLEAALAWCVRHDFVPVCPHLLVRPRPLLLSMLARARCDVTLVFMDHEPTPMQKKGVLHAVHNDHPLMGVRLSAPGTIAYAASVRAWAGL